MCFAISDGFVLVQVDACQHNSEHTHDKHINVLFAFQAYFYRLIRYDKTNVAY